MSNSPDLSDDHNLLRNLGHESRVTSHESRSDGFNFALALLLALILIAALLWSLRATAAGITSRRGWESLQDSYYSAAQRSFEDALNSVGDLSSPGYDPALNRLRLSYAYLARRDEARAIAVLPNLSSLDNWVVLQHGLALAVSGDTSGAVALWSGLAERPNLPTPVYRSALWHLAQSAWPQVGQPLQTLAAINAPGDPYVAAANLRLAQFLAPQDAAAAQQHLALARAAMPVNMDLSAAPDMLLGANFSEGLPANEFQQLSAQLQQDLATAAQLQTAGASAASLQVFWGRSYTEQAEWELAKTMLQSSLQQQPDVADAHAYLGLVLQRLGDLAGAEREMLQATKLDPTRTLANHLLARLYMEQKRWDDALPQLENALHADPTNIVLHLDIATWYEGQGSYDLAQQEYTQATQLQASLGAASEINTYLLLANFYLERNYAIGGCQASLQAAKQAVARNSGAAEYEALGWAEHLCGSVAPAMRDLQTAIRLDPALAAAFYHLGVTLKEQGQPQSARRALEHTQDLDPGGLWERRALAAIVGD